MTVTIKKAGSIFISLPLLLFIIFLSITPSLEARGSGEFSAEYKNDLRILFEELVIKIESGEMNGLKAKADLALLRSEYRIEYSDFAGKIDAVIDEVEESKKGYLDALNDFTIIQNNSIKARKQVLTENQNSASENDQYELNDQSEQKTSQERNSPKANSEGGGSSGKKN